MKLEQLIPRPMEGTSDMAKGWNSAVASFEALTQMARKFGYELVLKDEPGDEVRS